jgi:hypothetical protein
MLTGIANVYYFVIDGFAAIWRRVTDSSSRWWDSRYR